MNVLIMLLLSSDSRKIYPSNGWVGLAVTLGNTRNISDKPIFLCSSAKMAHMQRGK